MDSEKNEQESEDSKENATDLSDIKNSLPAMPNYDAVAASVRRSPRAPARVKVKFHDVLNGEAGNKKRSASAGSTSSSSNGSESSPTTPTVSGPKKTDDGREIDTYCWLCHKVGDDSVCICCPRVFHFQCLGPAHRFNEEGLCPECKLSSTDGTKLKESLTVDKLADLLPFALNRMITNVPQLKTFKYSEKESKDLICPMDYSTLLQNIKEHHYKTTIAFLSDVKWILHNLTILHGASHTLSTNAKKFVSICKAEMLDIEACPDCYAHAYSYDENWFCKLCSANHTLVWAKLKGFPFWPSKVVKVIDGVADVRFFGSHEKGKVPVNHCYRLSKENPNDKIPKNVHFKKALEELEVYTKSVHRKFGPIVYHPLATVYDPGPENINTKQSTRKREHTSSGLALKSKKQKVSPISLRNKDPVVELDKLSEATVRINTEPCSSSTTSPDNSKLVKKTVKQISEPQVLKKPDINSDEKTVSDVNSKSIVAVESSAAEKSLHKKNFMKHLELNTISPQGTLDNHAKNCNGLPLPEVTNEITSSRQEDVNNSSSIKDGDKSTDNSNVAETTVLERTENPVELQNSTPVTGTDAVNVISNPTDKDSSLHLAHQKNSNIEDIDLPVEVSTTQNNDVTMSETNSVNNVDVVMSGDNNDDDALDTSLSGEKEVPSVPNTNSEESVSGSRNDVSDIVSDVLNRLEFFEEAPANESEQEAVYIEQPDHIDLSGDHENYVEMIPTPPYSMNILAGVPQCNEVHSNPATDAPEVGSSSENMEPMFIQQPPLYVQVPTGENSQNETVCCIPLPEGLSLEKYQNKVFSVMRATVEEIWHDYVNTPTIQKIILTLQKEIEDLKAKYKKDMKDVSDNTALILESVKSQMEKEKIEAAEAVEALKKKCEEEKEKAIKETKKKQWCAYCGKEAMYYCCWNTSYCNYACQEAHWSQHMFTCSQTNPYDENQPQQSPQSSDTDTQRNQGSKGEGNRSKKFCKETYSKQQRSRGGPSSTVSSSKGQMPPPYQSPPHQPPFVTSSQPPMMTPNYVTNVIPTSMPVMAPPHITSVGPSSSPFVNRLPPPPPPPSPSHQSLPFVSGQHPHQSQNAPHYQTANSQGNRMLSPVNLSPRTSFQPRQFYSSPSTSKLYMGGPRDVRYSAKPSYM